MDADPGACPGATADTRSGTRAQLGFTHATARLRAVAASERE